VLGDYLRGSFLRTRQTQSDLGKPLYNNQAKNLFMVGPRGFGKSYMAADIAAHTFTTDGRTVFDPSAPLKDKAEILNCRDHLYGTTADQFNCFILEFSPSVHPTMGSFPGSGEDTYDLQMVLVRTS
jgi:ERCC4-related helicase